LIVRAVNGLEQIEPTPDHGDQPQFPWPMVKANGQKSKRH
jgi:hypothetical protein